ncbi:MAG: hypothetical protein M0O95_06315 [Clostridiales bacterium]|nr:hypothetical protein [Clostridiales bacterium]MCK9288435.1 hypothetical protein [Sphaerochaetaceae bacterium]
MRFKEWIFLLIVVGLGMTVANLIGFGVSVTDSLPGVLILLGISIVAVGIDRVSPLKLPVIAYCSLLAMFLASPISPISDFVIQAANKINFTAPLTMVGSYAGMSISNQLKTFVKQGWKMVIITVLVMTGTFIGSLVIAQLVLGWTGSI